MEKNTQDFCRKKSKVWSIGGILMTGSMFVGMGLGQYFGARQIGLYIGLGVGFLAMGTLHLVYLAKS
jgi:hypothetical protein